MFRQYAHLIQGPLVDELSGKFSWKLSISANAYRSQKILRLMYLGFVLSPAVDFIFGLGAT